MLVKRLLMIVITSIFILSACTPEHSKIIVAEFDKTSITMGEFETSYSKNLGGPNNVKNDSLEALKKFLDLYVNYKMKLRDAFVRGYMNDPGMQKEILDYKANIGSTLFLEDSLYEPALKNLYEKRKVELRASHIFLVPDTSMNETQANSLAKSIIDSLKNGGNFGSFAKKYSKDNYTKDIGGDVYYFTAGQIAASKLEDAIYSLNVGEIYSEPVNSGFGIHVIKLTDKLERKPAVQAQHILVSLRDSTGKPLTDTTAAFAKIMDIKKKAEAGEDFGELALKYSDDPGSAKKQGDLGTFARGRMVREFDAVAFSLNKDEISKVVRTQFGYHIIKLNDIKTIPTYDEERESLRDIYKKTRYKNDYAALIEGLKNQFGFKKYDPTFEKVYLNLDSLKIGQDYRSSYFHKEFGGLELFTVNEKKYAVDSLINFIQTKNINLGRKVDKNAFGNAYNQYEAEMILKEKGLVYDKNNPEFAKLIAEYEDGVYLFKILEDEVWSKINIDSNMIAEYWKNNKEDFKWGDRVELKAIFVNKDSLINTIYGEINNGSDFDSLYSKYNVASVTKDINGLMDVNTNAFTQNTITIKNIGEVSRPFHYQNGWAIVKLINREPSRIKNFEEAKAEAASALQERETKRLEEEYINKLKSVYKPVYYYDELQKAFKN